MNFGGIEDPEFSSFDPARVVILPVSYEDLASSEPASGAMAVIEASRRLELYDEETDAEVYKIGIHTLREFLPRATPEATLDALHRHAKELLNAGKFVCAIGAEHAISVPLITAHAEHLHDISVLQIAARPRLRDASGGASSDSTMTSVVREMRIPSVQVGVRSVSIDEARVLESGLPTKIFCAGNIAGRTNWIDDALSFLTDNVYLNIDVNGLDPGIMPSTRAPEPGGLGWYESLALIRKLAAKRQVVGMDLVEYRHSDQHQHAAFLCAKLIYKSLAFIFDSETRKVVRG